MESMISYITANELAEKWATSIQATMLQLESGHVDGAFFHEGSWRIPKTVPSFKECQYKAFMPIWGSYVSGESARMIEELPDAQERGIAVAGQYYFRAQYSEASEAAEAYLMSDVAEIRASALLLHCMSNVPLGNTAATMADIKMLLEEKKSAKDAHMDVIYDYISCLLRVFFHDDEEFEPISMHDFSELPKGVRFYALYAYVHALYLSHEYHQALGVAESALMMAEDRYPSVCIYLYLAAAMAAINVSQISLADSFFQKAWALAEPEGYIQPFVEHHGLLQGQVEKYFRDRSPEHYRRISECVIQFSRGWIKVHNPESVNKVTDLLTPFEFALAMMAAKGKSNHEIAEYQNISVNTVKAYLSSVYQKLDVNGRKDLLDYLNK